MLRSRVPAEKWSISTATGLSVAGALNDARGEAMSQLGAGVVTDKTREYLLWRYAEMPELHYRGLPR
jgi:shikimate kinase